MVNLYNGSAWAAEQQVYDLSGVVGAPDLASDGRGYAVVWAQRAGSTDDLYATVYGSGVWEVAFGLEAGTGNVSEPAVLGAAGSYSAAWIQADAVSGRKDVWALVGF